MSNFIAASGRLASVTIGGNAVAAKTYQIDMEQKANECSNMINAPYRVYSESLFGATVSLSGPYDVGPSSTGGEEALVIGNLYTVVLTIATGVSYSFSALLSKVSIKQDVDAFATLDISLQPTGSFTASVV